MQRIIKISKTIRNNWKKSALGVVALYYGAVTVKEKYEINVLMRAACKEAVKYGDSLIPIDRNPTVITVILNPVANKRKAKRDFEKYCEPLLHLAGLQVDVIQTTSEGSAKEIVENLRGTEAIIVAGGDGTFSETVTGLLRRNDGANQFPLGVLPLGRTNKLGNSLFQGGTGVEKVKQLIEACMAIIKGDTIWKDAMKIEPMEQDEDAPSKPVFAMTSLEWGAFRDTMARRDKYWIYGSLRDYASYIFNGYKESLNWNCSGVIKYTPPCIGCGNCIQKRPEIKTKWHFFMPNTQKTQTDTVNVTNPECATSHEICFKTSDFRIYPRKLDHSGIPSLSIVIGKNKYSYSEFVSEGWRRLKDPDEKIKWIAARTVELLPNESGEQVIVGIDREEFEVKPVRITLLPNIVKLFCNSDKLTS